MSMQRKIKVLVIEDNPTKAGSLAQILGFDAEIQVVRSVRSGRAALQYLDWGAVDVILMDIETPISDGFEATRTIMETRPLPIIICKGRRDVLGGEMPFRLMEAGAVACVEKPPELSAPEFRQSWGNLLRTVKLMSEIKVVHRWPRGRKPIDAKNSSGSPAIRQKSAGPIEFIGIGASTGGPPVLQTILAAMPTDFSSPILIVQHIAPGFLTGLCEWLGHTTGMKIHIAAHRMQAKPGHVYLAPDGLHMTVDFDGTVLLKRGELDSGVRPSVNQLFRSLAENFGPSSIGVLLTGMGKDGALELKHMRDSGATTIAQDQDTSVVHGMPGEAIAVGAASYIFPADKIAPALVAIVQQQCLGVIS
jgi:two-component system, chemotaxis family, protein-glutamate methylesterase/glutaminase